MQDNISSTGKPVARKGVRHKPEHLTCVLRVVDWKSGYRFGISPIEEGPGPCWEHSEVEVMGEVIEPVAIKGRMVTLSIHGSRGVARKLTQSPESDLTLTGCGELAIREKALFLGLVPFDALAGLVVGLSTGSVRAVTLFGDALRYGSANIKLISFHRELPSEDVA